MDSNETNRPLTEVPMDKTPETLVSSPAQAEENNTMYVPKQTKEEVIKRLKELNEDACNADKQELDLLKQTFYKLHKAEQETARKTFIAAGGAPEAFVMPSDDSESRFKEAMSSIKEKRSAMLAEQEKEKEENLQKKLAIIEKLKELSESHDDANKAYNEFKKLQQEWNEIKQVPAAKINELWKNYQLYAEKFYDLIKLNNEFREYDFKKNLEIKLHLCEAAEKLANEEDIISAFHQLQKLHQEFRDTGPVAKELREEIWTRFKTASTTVNRRHQQHFEALKEKEQRNLDEKTVICEIVETMEYDTFTTFQDWENKTQEVIALQAKWKTIGYAPQKMNVKIFERYNEERRFPTQNWEYGDQGLSFENPYWIINREMFPTKKSRYMLHARVQYDIFDWLNIAGRVRLDKTHSTEERKLHASTLELYTGSSKGSYTNKEEFYTQTYADVMANINKRFGIHVVLM